MVKTDKPLGDAELRRRIQELIDYKGGGFNQENVADIIDNALKLLTDVKDSGDVRVIQTAVRELRYAFRLFAPYGQVRKVTIFGSARTLPSRLSTSRRWSSAAKWPKPASWSSPAPAPALCRPATKEPGWT